MIGCPTCDQPHLHPYGACGNQGGIVRPPTLSDRQRRLVAEVADTCVVAAELLENIQKVFRVGGRWRATIQRQRERLLEHAAALRVFP